MHTYLKSKITVKAAKCQVLLKLINSFNSGQQSLVIEFNVNIYFSLNTTFSAGL